MTPTINTIDLPTGRTVAYEATGSGEPLVLVHGGWSDHHNWDPVVPALARSFRVIAYDRPGHGQSAFDPGTRRDQEDDLGPLIEELGSARAHVVGTSYGGAIALGLAGRRPDVVRSVIAHEPPLISVAGDDPEIRPQLEAVGATIQSIIRQVARGQAEAGARQFVEEVALGPGAWAQLPVPLRETMVQSAPAFVAEQQDPDWADVDPAAVARLRCPVLLTQGDQSPRWFLGIVEKLDETIDVAEVRTYVGAGHAPHITHPDEYLARVTGFLAGARDAAVLA